MGSCSASSSAAARAEEPEFNKATEHDGRDAPTQISKTEVEEWASPSQPDTSHKVSEAAVEAKEHDGGALPREAEWQPPGVPMDAAPPCKAAAVRAQYEDAFGDEAMSHAAQQVQVKAVEVYNAYYGFFNHIGLRKGWRTAPFEEEEVQVPFWTAAQTVALVREELDRLRGDGVILRQVDGSAMNFLWSWNPDRRLSFEPSVGHGDTVREFVSGLVFATLSDGHGLVEGLQKGTVEVYVDCHPLWRRAAPEVT